MLEHIILRSYISAHFGSRRLRRHKPTLKIRPHMHRSGEETIVMWDRWHSEEMQKTSAADGASPTQIQSRLLKGPSFADVVIQDPA